MQILAKGLNFPEGPAFDSQGKLWCVELKGGNLIRLSERKITRFHTGGAPNGMTFDNKGDAWVCDSQKNAIRCFDPKSNQWKTIVNQIDGEPLFKPNDLAFDVAGNLIFTCPGDSRTVPTGYVCCLKPNGTLTKIVEGMYFPNGMAFMDRGRSLVIAETYKQRLWRGMWKASTAQWLDAKPWTNVGGPIGPDGITMGVDGLLYVAVYGSGQIKVVNKKGHIVKTYDLPGKNPTNVAIDPSSKLGLVVTEAEKGLLLSVPI